MSRSLDRALVAGFLVVISLPLAATLAGVEGADPVEENRTLAPPPTWTSITRVGSELAAWFDDHFAFRSTLIRWEGAARYLGLGMSPSSSALVGSQGWLYYTEDGATEDLGRTHAFTPEELLTWKKTIQRTEKWLEGLGIAYVFTVAPDKHEIYPEHLPAGIRSLDAPSRADQIFDVLHDSKRAVDVRQTLEAAKFNGRLYQLTDTHWSDTGAWLVYKEIIEAVRRQNPAVPAPWALSDFDTEVVRRPGGDLARMMGLRRYLDEEMLELVPRRPRRARAIDPPGGSLTAHHGWLITEIPGSSLPRAVVFRDSFVSALAPFLSEHFSRVAYAWQKDFDAPLVQRERADVVIQEIASRHLYTFTPSPELIPEQ